MNDREREKIKEKDEGEGRREGGKMLSISRSSLERNLKAARK